MEMTNIKIKPLGVNYYVVIADSERFGDGQIMFEGISYDECLDYIEKNIKVPEPSYYVIKDLVQCFMSGYYEKITGRKAEEVTVERFDNLDQALERFHYYKGMDYWKEDIPSVNNDKEVSRRLALGVSANIPGRKKFSHAELDLLHTCKDKVLLVSDSVKTNLNNKEDAYDTFMIMKPFVRDVRKLIASGLIDEYSYFEGRGIHGVKDMRAPISDFSFV